ncbi:MAG TPA: HPF/RaiA family ribosome-associated protein [Vulgatibacter sp.]|nr:HPF/RaiA family ribosome-associated protein [Vulgatibacter sp.]
MDVEVKAFGGLELTDDLADFCRAKIVEPIRRIFDREGPTLEIELSDLYGPKGGVDKRCRITYTMPHTRTITVTEVADDIYKAVDGASQRFRRLVARYKARKLVKTRYPTKYFVAAIENRMQPAPTFTPADITIEEDSLAAAERRRRERRLEEEARRAEELRKAEAEEAQEGAGPPGT